MPQISNNHNTRLRTNTDTHVPGLLEVGNIDIYHRPIVHNADGSISTTRSKSFNFDGREVLLPTVSEDGKIMDDTETIKQYRETGRHLGIFDNAENADVYAQWLHEKQAKLLGL